MYIEFLFNYNLIFCLQIKLKHIPLIGIFEFSHFCPLIVIINLVGSKHL